MISRIWHGWTTHQNADAYEALLKEEIFVGIENRHISGFKSIQLLRRQLPEETEFITIMTFDSLEAVKEFAGADYEQAVVPEKQESCYLISINGHSITKLEQREPGSINFRRSIHI